jgi:hypothetical protein
MVGSGTSPTSDEKTVWNGDLIDQACYLLVGANKKVTTRLRQENPRQTKSITLYGHGHEECMLVEPSFFGVFDMALLSHRQTSLSKPEGKSSSLATKSRPPAHKFKLAQSHRPHKYTQSTWSWHPSIQRR